MSTAARLLGLLDLTRLERPDDPEQIDALVDRAVTPAGAVAAVCLYPEWLGRAVEPLAGTGVRIAAVANFPAGDDDAGSAAAEDRFDQSNHPAQRASAHGDKGGNQREGGEEQVRRLVEQYPGDQAGGDEATREVLEDRTAGEEGAAVVVQGRLRAG